MLKPGAPFERDMSLWLAGGGFTFRSPGVHTLVAEFDTGRGIARSNPLVLEVLPDRAGGSRRDIALLRDAHVQSLLYHRDRKLPPDMLRFVEEELRERPKQRLKPHLQYALSRVYGAADQRPKRARGGLRGMVAEALDKSDVLSSRQRHYLVELQDKLSQR